MLMATVAKLVPAVGAAVLTSLVHTAVLALLARVSSAPGVARRRKSVRPNRSRRAQADLVSFRRRTARRAG